MLFSNPEKERDALEAEEARLREETKRAHSARQFTENQLVKDAFAAVREEAMAEFKNAKPGDTHSLELAKIKLNVVDTVAVQLLTHIETGQLAASRLTTVKNNLERLRKRRHQFTRQDADVE